jgi:hypothetical protein
LKLEAAEEKTRVAEEKTRVAMEETKVAMEKLKVAEKRTADAEYQQQIATDARRANWAMADAARRQVAPLESRIEDLKAIVKDQAEEIRKPTGFLVEQNWKLEEEVKSLKEDLEGAEYEDKMQLLQHLEDEKAKSAKLVHKLRVIGGIVKNEIG